MCRQMRELPTSPITSARAVSSGSISRHASTRGPARNFTGSTPRHASASSCSVTRIVASSAAIAEPTRPDSITAASTGPSSRTSDM